MTERLYGVVHSTKISFLGIGTYEYISVVPSGRLLNELLELPQGSTVGIEYHPHLVNIPQLKDGHLKMPRNQLSYWHEIKRFCKLRGLKVIYLEDINIYEKYANKLIEYGRLGEQLTEALKHGGNPDNDPKLAELWQKVYKAGIEVEYIHEVEREEKMIEQIAKTQPTAVIVGQGHGDLFMLDSDNLKQGGVVFDRYKNEQIEPEYPFFEEYSRKRYSELCDNPALDRSFLVERELLIRSYRAVTKGRILPDKSPSYIGTWDTTCPARGLFEVYAEDLSEFSLQDNDLLMPLGNFCGTVEDTQGTAILMGNVENGKVQFEKCYDDVKSSRNAAKSVILYEGAFQNGRYEGIFTNNYAGNNATYGESVNGKFIMEKFPHSTSKVE